MSASAGPDIIENGLVLCLDAGNRESYPGSGTTWTSLGTSVSGGTLVNGPTFSSANGGSIVFDGVDDYAVIPNNFYLLDMTVLGWIYIDSTTGGSYRGLFYTAPNTSFGGWWIGYNVGVGLACGFGPSYNPRRDSSVQLAYNTWHMIGFTINNTTKITTGYYNNALSFGTFSFTSVTSGNNLNIGRGNSGFNNGEYFKGRVANCQIYNRALSPAEVLQNYNATKGRFLL